MCGNARKTHRRHHVHDGVAPVHAGEMVGNCTGNGNAEVNEVERACSFCNAGRKTRFLEGPARLCLHDLSAADAEQRQNGDGHDDDAHAAQPGKKASPAVHGVRQLVESRKYCGAGRGETGHGLEVRSFETKSRHMQHERNRGKSCNQRPGERDKEKAVAGGELLSKAV